MRPVQSALFIFFIAVLFAGCRKPLRSVVLYIDPEPEMTFGVMWHYEREAHVKVTQYDHFDYSGATSAALITSERDHPKADVYWSGDPVYCEILRQRGLTIPFDTDSQIPKEYQDPHQSWIGFAARARVLLVRNSLKDKPHSIRDFANPQWKGRGALADPLSGTTRSHFAALAAVWGDRKLADFYNAVQANGVRITKDTDESADLVTKGEADFTLVDTNVALLRVQKQKPVEIVYPDMEEGEPGIMLIPNALMIVKGCKDFDAAKDLVSYLTSLDGETRVVSIGTSHIPLQLGIPIRTSYIRHIETLRVMRFDYTAAAQKLQDMEKILNAGN